MGIPESLINDFARVPRDRSVTMIVRHAARFPIVPPDLGFNVPLTEEGVRTAEALGVLLGQDFAGGRLASAPVGRCQDTADAIARGAGWAGQAVPDQRISHPFFEASWEVLRMGKLNGTLPRAVRVSLDFLLDHPAGPPRLDVMVTHDTIICVLAHCLFHAEVLGPKHWPGFLEGLFLWRDGERIHARWRGEERSFRLEPVGLGMVSEQAVQLAETGPAACD